jgi:AmiR/NasT family two-component response regulator
MAIGILMATHGIRDGAAFDLLRVASQRSNRRLRDIADEVVRTGELRSVPTKAAGQ